MASKKKTTKREHDARKQGQRTKVGDTKKAPPKLPTQPFDSLKKLVAALGKGRLDRKIILTYAEPSGDVEIYARLPKKRGEERAGKGPLLYTTESDAFQREVLEVLGFNVEEREADLDEEDDEDEETPTYKTYGELVKALKAGAVTAEVFTSTLNAGGTTDVKVYANDEGTVGALLYNSDSSSVGFTPEQLARDGFHAQPVPDEAREAREDARSSTLP